MIVVLNLLRQHVSTKYLCKEWTPITKLPSTTVGSPTKKNYLQGTYRNLTLSSFRWTLFTSSRLVSCWKIQLLFPQFVCCNQRWKIIVQQKSRTKQLGLQPHLNNQNKGQDASVNVWKHGWYMSYSSPNGFQPLLQSLDGAFPLTKERNPRPWLPQMDFFIFFLSGTSE